MLTRLIYGGRFSWLVGIIPVVLAFVVGGGLGIVAGFAGGKINMPIMRVTDVFYAFPSVLLPVAVSGSLGAGIVNAILSLTIVFIPPVIRVAESVTTGGAEPRLFGSGAPPVPVLPRSSRCTSCPTSWARSSSTPPAWSASP